MRTESEIKQRISDLHKEANNIKPHGFFEHITGLKRTYEIHGEIKGLLFSLEESKEKQIITINI